MTSLFGQGLHSLCAAFPHCRVPHGSLPSLHYSIVTSIAVGNIYLPTVGFLGSQLPSQFFLFQCELGVPDKESNRAEPTDPQEHGVQGMTWKSGILKTFPGEKAPKVTLNQLPQSQSLYCAFALWIWLSIKIWTYFSGFC